MTTKLALLFTALFLSYGCSGTSDGTKSSTGSGTTGDATSGNGSGTDAIDATSSDDGADNDTGSSDGGADDSLYKGSFSATVSTDGQSEEFAGKIELKLRTDGLFSGSGSGAATNNNGNSISLELHGTLAENGTLDGELAWKWVDKTQGEDVVCPIAGSLTGEEFQGDFTGGTQQQNIQGSFTLLP